MADHVSASDYSRRILRVVIAQICQDTGWQAIESTALSVVVEVLERYLLSVGRSAHLWNEHATGRHGDFVNMATDLLWTNANSLNEVATFAAERECPTLTCSSWQFSPECQHPSVKIGKDLWKALYGSLDSDSEEETSANAEGTPMEADESMSADTPAEQSTCSELDMAALTTSPSKHSVSPRSAQGSRSFEFASISPPFHAQKHQQRQGGGGAATTANVADDDDDDDDGSVGVFGLDLSGTGGGNQRAHPDSAAGGASEHSSTVTATLSSSDEETLSDYASTGGDPLLPPAPPEPDPFSSSRVAIPKLCIKLGSSPTAIVEPGSLIPAFGAKRKHSDTVESAATPTKKNKKEKKEKKSKKDKKDKKEAKLKDPPKLIIGVKKETCEVRQDIPVLSIRTPIVDLPVDIGKDSNDTKKKKKKDKEKKKEKKEKKEKKSSSAEKEKSKTSKKLGSLSSSQVVQAMTTSTAAAGGKDSAAAGHAYICPVCRQPDDGVRGMVGCEVCSSDIWYHMECVGYDSASGLDWLCPTCSKKTKRH